MVYPYPIPEDYRSKDSGIEVTYSDESTRQLPGVPGSGGGSGGGGVDPADASAGQVPVADGEGGYGWETPKAVVDIIITADDNGDGGFENITLVKGTFNEFLACIQDNGYINLVVICPGEYITYLYYIVSYNVVDDGNEVIGIGFTVSGLAVGYTTFHSVALYMDTSGNIEMD